MRQCGVGRTCRKTGMACLSHLSQYDRFPNNLQVALGKWGPAVLKQRQQWRRR